ncbi:hypothetical protein GW17_00018815 [Ensete ventricosum]|nr:hypothetical protein GW17_00018815 [Ensete ventricosum]
MTVAVPPGKEFYYETFGAISVIDDILREGPERDSKLIGRAQGLLAQASLEKPALLSAVNFVFTAGKYNGSTISILGRAVLTELIERAIVGGAGMFRMAQGYTLAKVISSEEGYLIMELDAYMEAAAARRLAVPQTRGPVACVAFRQPADGSMDPYNYRPQRLKLLGHSPWA